MGFAKHQSRGVLNREPVHLARGPLMHYTHLVQVAVEGVGDVSRIVGDYDVIHEGGVLIPGQVQLDNKCKVVVVDASST